MYDARDREYHRFEFMGGGANSYFEPFGRLRIDLFGYVFGSFRRRFDSTSTFILRSLT
jgi:hypothetical protein